VVAPILFTNSDPIGTGGQPDINDRRRATQKYLDWVNGGGFNQYWGPT